MPLQRCAGGMEISDLGRRETQGPEIVILHLEKNPGHCPCEQEGKET